MSASKIRSLPSRPVPLEGIWGPIDALRHGVLRTLVRTLGNVGKRLIADRQLRVALTATIAIGLALTFTIAIPLWMLAIGPIVLGVPHVLGDVRYLIVRRGYHRRLWLVVLCLAPLIAAWSEQHVTWVILACVAAAFASRATPTRRFIGVLVLASIAALTAHFGYWSDVVFAHAHNVIGVLLWLLWAPRKGIVWFLPVLAYVGVWAFVLLGGLDFMAARESLDVAWPGLSYGTHAWTLAPSLAEPWALRLVLVFAFAQSIHYWVWLRLVPEEDRGRSTTRSFRASWRALYRDLGPWILLAAAGSAIVVAVWACTDVAHARAGYLRMAIFHGQIELVALTLFLMEGRPGPLHRHAEARLER